MWLFQQEGPSKIGFASLSKEVKTYQRLRTSVIVWCVSIVLWFPQGNQPSGDEGVAGGFGRLKVPLPVDNEERLLLIRLICQLYQVRTRLVGINQIREVFMPAWERATVSPQTFADFTNAVRPSVSLLRPLRSRVQACVVLRRSSSACSLST